MSDPEIWKDVLGYEGIYQISNLGRVYSVSRLDARRHARTGRFVKVHIDKRTGYPVFYPMKNAKLRMVSLHTALLEAFVGPRPPNMEACHGDDDRLNFCLSNLRWDTRKNNFTDRDTNGRTQRGSKHSKAKLSESDVIKIRQDLFDNRSGASLARLYGVSKETIYDIKNRRSWKHIA